ncbi:MAG TPA: hypothetical protein VFH95_01975 [Candidatus Kapabacteria bacterium]|nr:hypothetical protein [Candidatus Kapabacteria bacterium]
MRKSLFGFAVLTVSISLAHAQTERRDSAAILGVAAASLVPASLISAIVFLNQEAFWKYAKEVPFHVSNDPPYAMHIDKFSHFYGSAAGSDLMRYSYERVGLSDETSVWLGGGLTFAAGIAIEMEDARHGDDPEYGFSPGDAAADLVGASLPVLRHYYPVFNRLETKLSVWPSAAYKTGIYKSIADDYESQYYWLSFDLHGVTPLPAWLDLALGFSAEHLLRPANGLGYQVPPPNGIPSTDVFFGPDINLKGIPIEGSFWKGLMSVLSYVRIPFPALQFYPRTKFWWLR